MDSKQLDLGSHHQDTIYTYFQNTVQKHRQETAIIENGRSLTFGELSLLVDSIAGNFQAEIKSVGIVMNHRIEMIAAILAVLKCGARYVPAEPAFPIGRIHYMMNEAEVDFVITDKEYSEKLEGFSLLLADWKSGGVDVPALEKAALQNSNAPAYVLYTSGTTGRPKGICVTNRNVCHYARAFAQEFHPTSGDIMLQYSVCTFDIFVEEVFASLLNGIALAIPTEEDKANVDTLMAFVERHHITMISGFPYLLAEINHLSEIPSSLRLMISGGDVLRAGYVANLMSKVDIYNTYGPSETTVCTSYYRCNDTAPLEDGTYPIGTAVRGASIRILDGDGKELPRGEVGEICIYGDGVSLGYIGEHEEENKAFVNQPDGSIMYRSGDLGYVLPDGNIAFLYRKDTQVMIMGKRVEPAEVESVICQCEGVAAAAVKACLDERGLSYLVAYIVPDDESLRLSALKRKLARFLTSFMIPEFFIQLKSLPLNENGKLDTSALPVVMKEGAS